MDVPLTISVVLNQKIVLPGLTYFGVTTFWYSIVSKLRNRITNKSIYYCAAYCKMTNKRTRLYWQCLQ